MSSSPHQGSPPSPPISTFASLGHPDNTLHGENIQVNHGHAATTDSEPPTINRERTTAHLGASDMPSPLGYQVIGDTSSGLKTVSSTHSSMSNVIKHSSQFLRSPKDKETLITSLSTQIPEPTLTQVQEIQNVEYDLHVLRSQRIADYSQPVYVAPMAKPSLHASDDILFPLMDKVKDFLTSDCQVMLILGDPAAGKSTFSQQLEYVLWQEYIPGGRIPLFINLPALEQPRSKLLHEQLNKYEFSECQNQELERYRQFTLICDGYDESQLRCNLHTTNLLNQSGMRDSKLIITCRSQYLGPDYRDLFVPKAIGQYNRTVDNLFQECVIAPFSKDQIEDYVERYIPLEPRTWVKHDYMDMLETVPNLMDLVKNPFLLTLCLEALPSVTQGTTDLTRLRVTRIQLYDNFVQHWLRVNKRRLYDLQLQDADLEAFTLLLDDGFERHVVLYQMELAAAIFQEQKGRPIVEYSHLRDGHSWKARFFGPDPERELLRDSSLLSRAGTQYRFIHRSILEYFYSCNIYGPNTNDDTFDPHSHSDLVNTVAATGDHLFSQHNLVTEPSIIHFLSERVHESPIFKQHLIDILEQSKVDKQAAQAAANSITIMVKAGVRFNGRDLRGIRISGADLSGGEFDSAQLQGADLTDVNLTKSWIRQVDFNRATMEGVDFGELPYLELSDCVFSCAYSPDGMIFAAGFLSGAIITYNTISWTQIHTLEGHFKGVHGLAFSPSSEHLLSGSVDKTARLWDCATGTTDFILEGHTNGVTSVAYSPSGDQVASCSDDGIVRLWDAGSGSVSFVLSCQERRITAIAYSSDGRNIASVGKDGSIEVFDTKTGEVGLTVESELGYTSCIAYSPNGSKIVVGHLNGALQLWESSTGKPGYCWSDHSGPVIGIAFSPNGEWIASTGHDGAVKLWSAQTRRLVSTFTGHSRLVSDVAFSPNGLQMASASVDFTVRLWDLSAVEARFIEESLSDPARHVAYSPDGQFVISVSQAGDVRQYNAMTGGTERIYRHGTGGVRCVAISPDNLRIATCGTNGKIFMWSAGLGLAVVVLAGGLSFVNDVTFSPCIRWIAAGGADKTICLWDTCSGVSERELVGHLDSVVRLQFSPNGQQIISFGSEGFIRIWDLNTGIGRDFYKWSFHLSFYKLVRYSPKSLQITASSGGAVRIWDQSSNEPQDTLKHSVDVLCFAWSHCEKWLAVGSVNTIWLWQYDSVEEWEGKLTIRNFHGDITSIAWRSNTLEFVSGCADGSVRVWRLLNTSGVWSAQLVWSTGPIFLAASGAAYSDAIGLSPVNRQLLEQRVRKAIKQKSLEERWLEILGMS